jgi:chemotaxis protein CheZ
MPVRRAVFRIEEFVGGLDAAPPIRARADRQADDCDLMSEVRRLRLLLETKPAADRPAEIVVPTLQEVESLRCEIATMYEAIHQTKQEIAAVHVNGIDSPAMARLADELAAVVVGTERATQKILQASEIIASLAKYLAATAKAPLDEQAARDIINHTTRIFEVCNFQDLAGQRVTTVTSTLKFIEEHLVRMMDIWGGPSQFQTVMPSATFRGGVTTLVNGPRLEGDAGHVSQDDIDELFP